MDAKRSLRVQECTGAVLQGPYVGPLKQLFEAIGVERSAGYRLCKTLHFPHLAAIHGTHALPVPTGASEDLRDAEDDLKADTVPAPEPNPERKQSGQDASAAAPWRAVSADGLTKLFAISSVTGCVRFKRTLFDVLMPSLRSVPSPAAPDGWAALAAAINALSVSDAAGVRHLDENSFFKLLGLDCTDTQRTTCKVLLTKACDLLQAEPLFQNRC